MMARPALAIGLATLGGLWSAALAGGFAASFSRHMLLHLGVIALAAPLIARGIAGSRLDPWRGGGNAGAALLAAALEFVVVWAWHAPALHDAARVQLPMLLLEQASFLSAGLLLWLSVLGGGRSRRAAGVLGLLLTSMHMTLLGVLLALAPRPLYRCVELCRADDSGLLQDQVVGGTLMLAVGGSVYLVAGLLLLAGMLREAPVRLPEGRTS